MQLKQLKKIKKQQSLDTVWMTPNDMELQSLTVMGIAYRLKKNRRNRKVNMLS